MPDLCPKGTELGVKPSSPSCPLTLPLYLGLPTEQFESQGTLPGRAASVLVKIQTVPVVVRTNQRTQKKYIEAIMGLIVYFMTLLGEM